MHFLIFFQNELSSAFDIWSIQHFSFGVFIGAYVSVYNKKHVHKILKVMTENNPIQIIETSLKNIFYFDLISILLIAYFWETTEHYIELGYFGSFFQNFTQHETYLNRTFGDPFVLVLGYFISIRYRYVKYLALIFLLIFFFYHIFIERIT